MASLAPFLALVASPLLAAELATPRWLGATGLSLALLLAGGLVTARAHRAGRWLSTLGSGSVLACLSSYLLDSPGLSLVAVILFVALIGSIWGLGNVDGARLSRRRNRELVENRARLASAFFAVEWALAAFWGGARPWAGFAAGAGLVLALGYIAAWTMGARRRQDPLWKMALAAGLFALAGAAIAARSTLSLLSWGGLVPLLVLVMPRSRDESSGFRRTWWRPVAEHPARLLVVTFLGLSSLGTLLLWLPLSSASGESIDFVDAAFTAVSAVCVTGLIVLDTPVDFSAFGEAVLLLLIQLGGLGIMGFSSVTLTLLGLRPSLRHEAAVAGLVGSEHLGALRFALGKIVAFTLLAEAVGALFLSAAFVRSGEAIVSSLWRGVFTSVSAFCNAGFALQSDSLIGFQDNPWVLHTVGTLIVVGGLSPATVAAAGALTRHERVAVGHKIALLATVVLLVAGALVILALEWSNTLSGLAVSDRITNAWFQSLTTRTAGFNSIDIAAVRPATLTVLMLLMFIGGSPGSTAGGVKTTTVAVLLLAVGSAVQGRWTASAFKRKLSHRTVYKAASIVTLGVLSLVLALFALQLTQTIDSRAALFEAVSALGTVGLSVGATLGLDEVGKIVIMACMFAGRVGPLSLFLFLQGRGVRAPWELVEEEVAVG